MWPMVAPAMVRRAAVGLRIRAMAARVRSAVMMAMVALMGLRGRSWGPAMPFSRAYVEVALTMTVEVREMMCAAIRAVMMVVVSAMAVREATLRDMTRIRASAPKVPMRESCMISRDRARS